MGLFDQFPYTNFHELNLDWILKTLKEIETTIEQFVSINSLKYADPIQWNITSQYEKNTIVIDPQTGTAYISVQPVPTGVALTNEDYWTVVFDLGSFVTRAAKNFTRHYEPETTLTATFNSAYGDWLVWGDTLYRALVNITAGDAYVVDSNIRHITIEEIIGYIPGLLTTNKASIVAAINEVLTTLNNTVGSLTDLSTTDKTNLVNAINEVLATLNNDIADVSQSIRYLVSIIGQLTDLTTSDKSSIVNAINENVARINSTQNTIGELTDLNTSDKSSVVNAINENVTRINSTQNTIGELTDLNTTDKSSVVNAINENVNRINITQNSVSALTGKYNTNNLAMFANKKVCIVGDSISSGDTYPPTWVDVVTAYLNTVNCTVVNVAVDGASVLGFGNDPSSIPTDCDYYIVFLGINDFHGQFSGSSMLAAVTAIANKCVRVGSVAWYVSPIRMLGAATDPATQNHTTPASAYRWIFETLFSNAGFKIISGLGAPSLNNNTKSTYMSDGLHPLPAYRYLLGEYILDSIIANTETFTESSTVKTATPTPEIGSGSIEITWLQNQCSIKFAVTGATFAASWNHIAKTTDWIGAAYGLIPEDPYFPPYWTSFNGDKFYARCKDGYIDLLAFGGAGTYDLVGYMDCPLFFSNMLG